MKLKGKLLGALLLGMLMAGGMVPVRATDSMPVKAEAFISEAKDAGNMEKKEASDPVKAAPAGTESLESDVSKEEEKKAPEKESKPKVDPMAGRSEKLLKEFYLIDGGTYQKVTGLLKSLNPAVTGLPADDKAYYFRLDKKLTDKYFRHVKTYDTNTHEELGEFLVAKDKSSVWRMDGDNPGMIFGSAEKLLKKSKLLVYPRYLALGSKGIVRLGVPGNVPAEVSAKSMNEKIARVDEDGIIEPVSTGKVSILVDYVLGDQKGTAAREINVLTKEELQQLAYAAYLNRIYIQQMMWYDDFWGDPWWGRPYGFRHRHRPPPPRHGHRPPPPPRGDHRPPPRHK